LQELYCNIVIGEGNNEGMRNIIILLDLFCMFQNLKSIASTAVDAGNRQEPEVVNVIFSKINNSLGLSIVAAKV